MIFPVSGCIYTLLKYILCISTPRRLPAGPPDDAYPWDADGGDQMYAYMPTGRKKTMAWISVATSCALPSRDRHECRRMRRKSPTLY